MYELRARTAKGVEWEEALCSSCWSGSQGRKDKGKARKEDQCWTTMERHTHEDLKTGTELVCAVEGCSTAEGQGLHPASFLL